MIAKLSESQQLLQESLRQFVAQEIAPHAAAWDRDSHFPQQAIAQCAQMGLAGMMVGKDLGGAEMTTMDYVIAMEEIARGCASTAVILSVNNSLVLDPLQRFGTPAQQQKYIPPLARGEKLGCFALTEPSAGSDAGSQRTIYHDAGDHFVVTGSKNFITNGPQADTCILFATQDRAMKNKGISAFIVERTFPGFSLGVAEKKMGICASHTSSITLDKMKIPKDNLLGKVGDGFKIAMATLDGGRIGIAAQAVGIAAAALAAATQYAQERHQFGTRIADFQGLRWMLTDMAMAVEAARLLTYQAAMVKDRGENYSVAAAQAKLFASETANRVANKAVQIHGGYGYIREYPVERHMRDAKITELYEGTSEIQRLVIAAGMLKDATFLQPL